MSRTLAKQRSQGHWSSSVEWYTEPWLMERITAFLGDYLDPCPARNGNVIEVNGLGISWKGRSVFCNPPYGSAIKPWITKAMTEPVKEVILLVPAFTETKWFLPLLSHSICFVQGRLNFMRPNETKPKNVPHASVLVYRGKRYKQFADAFCDLGPILRPYRAYRALEPTLLRAS